MCEYIHVHLSMYQELISCIPTAHLINNIEHLYDKYWSELLTI